MKQPKTYLIKFVDRLVPDGPEAVSIIEPAEILEVRGTDAFIFSGIAGDYLHIKDGDGAVVFAGETHLIKWCQIKQLKNKLKFINDADVILNEQAVHLQGQDNVFEGANKDV